MAQPSGLQPLVGFERLLGEVSRAGLLGLRVEQGLGENMSQCAIQCLVCSLAENAGECSFQVPSLLGGGWG